MATFAYRAIDVEGRQIGGVMEAEDEQALLHSLRQKDMTVLSVKRTRARRSREAASGGGRIPMEDVVVFTRQLATMVDAGLPLIQALDAQAEQASNSAFKAVIRRVMADVESGSTLSDALEKHPRVFSGLYVNLVKAGEVSGMLDEILDRIAGYLEASESLRRKVKSALVYPSAVTLIAIGITIFLLVVVIPKFGKIFSSLGGELPGPTRMLLAVSEALKQNILYVFGVIALGVVGLKLVARTPNGRYKLDKFKLEMPVFGELMRKVAIAKFARTLCTLVRAGVPILGSLEITAKTAGNVVVEQAVDSVRESIREGESIAEPLAATGVFPAMVVRMISVGEQTGSLEAMLGKIADFYEDQVNTAVAAMTSLIEPLIIAFLGIVIGTIVICMFLPVFKITELVG